MRSLFVFLAALSIACGSPSLAPETAASTRTPTPKAPEKAPLPPAPEPLVALEDGKITFEGAAAGSLDALIRQDGPSKVEPLYSLLAKRRQDSLRPGIPFRGAVAISVEPTAPIYALMAVVQTSAYAGFPTAWLAAEHRWVPLGAFVPSPPCGSDGLPPCPLGRPGFLLHAEGGGEGWRLRVPMEQGPVDEAGSDVTSFRSAVARLVKEKDIAAIVVHLSPNERFASVEPFLAALGEQHEATGFPHPVSFSMRPFGEVPEKGHRRTEKQAPTSGRVPPEEIQRIVRGAFGRFKACYERALAANPSAQGRVVVDFTIGEDGLVVASRGSLEGALPPSMVPCVRDELGRLRFPVPEGIVQVRYPIVFTPEDSDAGQTSGAKEP